MGTYILYFLLAVVMIMAFVFTVMIVRLRRVVPTNMTHVVQSTAGTVMYGGMDSSQNTYYAWPSWIPRIGVSVIILPESVFNLSLAGYEAYDSARLSFSVDISAFFRISDPSLAAKRISTIEELRKQLHDVLQGSVRKVLSNSTLEKIMHERSSLSDDFTKEVGDQLVAWGVITVKNIEFMDIRDNATTGSKVIANMMAKDAARIDADSRIAVANHRRAAEIAEIERTRDIGIKGQEADKQVGVSLAETDRTVRLAAEETKQAVQEAMKVTAQREADVKQVQVVRNADIAKAAAIVDAEREKETAVLQAAADLERQLRVADGFLANGQAQAKSQELMLMAPVTAQLQLAEKIGENESYQAYLLQIESIRKDQAVGIEMAKALAESKPTVIANGGNMQEGMTGLTKMFSPTGGVGLTGLLAGLATTPEGKALVAKFTTPKTEE